VIFLFYFFGLSQFFEGDNVSADGQTTSLFEIEISNTDMETGEIKSKSTAKVVKKNKTPDFLMLFTAGAPLLRDANLTTSSELVLSKILEKWVLRKNRVDISRVMIDHLKATLGYSRSSIYTAISLLKTKKILVDDVDGVAGDEIKGAWYLNPYIFGKGKWDDIKKLRYNLSVEFDFQQLKASSKSTRIAEYRDDELDDLENKDLKIIEHKMKKDELTNTIDAEILVEVQPKNKKENINKFLNDEPKQIKQFNPAFDPESEILREKNRTLELEIELKRAEIELKKVSTEELVAKMKARELGLI